MPVPLLVTKPTYRPLRHRPEVAIALRQRLNETVEQLDALRKEHAELEVKFDIMNKELTIAKSDCVFSFHAILYLC